LTPRIGLYRLFPHRRIDGKYSSLDRTDHVKRSRYTKLGHFDCIERLAYVFEFCLFCLRYFRCVLVALQQSFSDFYDAFSFQVNSSEMYLATVRCPRHCAPGVIRTVAYILCQHLVLLVTLHTRRRKAVVCLLHVYPNNLEKQPLFREMRDP